MQLYNTLSRSIEEFVPIDPSNVGIYACGPTVYRDIHIGNFRTYITSDILNRILCFIGYKTTFVMNITDVGHFRYSESAGKVIDPVMEEARHLGIDPFEVSKIYTEKFLADAKKLNLQTPEFLPKASDHIPDMIEIIKILLDKKIAYIQKGDVYFNVKKFRDYGKLSGNTLDKMSQLLEAVRVSVETDKKDSADFALWKKKGDRVMGWNSPWGEGVPGWHIECSAMSSKYLGRHFDIHVGGEDLIFPHHEDEIAQSEAVFGGKFVNYWVHSQFLLVDEGKMSRSKRNVYLVSELEKKGFNPLAYRYLTFQTHYRTRMNFTWKALESAQTALEKLYQIASSYDEPKIGCSEFENEFIQAINQDLNMPKAVAIMWELIRSDYPTSAKAATLYKMDEVLGLKIKDHANASINIPEQILEMVELRKGLRKQKKFALADQMRIKIEKKGYIIKDSKEGTKITRKVI